ncbi:MAG: hypothetical protein Q9159_000385 [Coniocarpon cinnabarinum]
MDEDLSLSQSLGGLRIANPDDDVRPGSPASPTAANAQFHPAPPPPPPPQPQSPPLQNGRAHELSAPAIDPAGGLDVASSLGYNPTAYAFQPNPSSPTTSPRPRSPSEPAYFYRKLSHRNSRGFSPQQPHDHPAPISRYPGSASNAQPPRPPARAPGRGIGGMMASSPRSPYPDYAEGSYQRVRGETSQSEPAGVRRSSSRTAASAAAAAMQGTNSARITSTGSRHGSSSHTAAYNHANFPPRQSSRPSAPSQSDSYQLNRVATQPVGIVGGEDTPPSSSEEWKEKGAAQGMQRAPGKDGKPVTKFVKKGVKDFKFGRTLGEGSYSTVMAATDRSTNKEYAIKVLDKRHIIKEKKVKYVNIEKDTLNRLTDHPGIVRLYYTFQDERQLYFVLDLATGGELLGVLKKTTSFDEECSRFYSAQILDSVEYMHSRGVIHRDLKPENVLLDDQMHVKITDFGTAKILEIPQPTQQQSQFGQVSVSNDPLDGSETDRAVSFVGTAEYVSPELLTNKNACKASDLWAFGCIIYQLLAGRPPFKAGNEYQTFQKIVNLHYTFPEGFPNAARDLVEKLLVLDPADRMPITDIKKHRFFEGTSWGKGLWKQKPPRLRPHNPHAPPRAAQLHTSSRQNAAALNESMSQSANKPSSKPSVSGTSSSVSSRPQPRVITELAPPSQLDIDWSPVLNKPNERILKLGNLLVTSAPAPHSPTSRNAPSVDTPTETPSKFSRLFGATTSKKRERLVMISSAGRLILAPSGGGKKEAKQMIELRDSDCVSKSQQDSKGYTVWCILTRERHLTFEDAKANTGEPGSSVRSTQEWLDMVEISKEQASQSNANSAYSGASGFDGLSPTSSADIGQLQPSDSSLGTSVLPHRHNILRKQVQSGDDDESIKGRKRFSKRHSKNGLAAVF